MFPCKCKVFVKKQQRWFWGSLSGVCGSALALGSRQCLRAVWPLPSCKTGIQNRELTCTKMSKKSVLIYPESSAGRWWPYWLSWQMIYQQKRFPLSLVSAVASVLSYSTELQFQFRFSNFIPINPLNFPVNYWKSPKVRIRDNKRRRNQTFEEKDLPALLYVVVYLFWCALGRLVLLLELTSLPRIFY